MVTDQHPAEPVVDDKERAHGGFSEIAQLLNKRFPKRRRPISRQLVHKWWVYREDNQFPEAISSTGTSNGGKGCSKFSYAEVVEWYTTHRLNRDKQRYTRSRMTATPPTQATGTENDDTLAA